MDREVYLDNSSTTRICDKAFKTLIGSVKKAYGNASSLHAKGINAKQKIEESRALIADFLGADDNEIYFTSGATESNNIAILGACRALKRSGNRIITTACEHPSVLGPVDYLSKQGLDVIKLNQADDFRLSVDDLLQNLTNKTILVSIMRINNELGFINDVEKAARLIKKHNPKTLVHVDAVQSFGKINMNLKSSAIDLLSFSSHKAHGPNGVGGLYISKNARILPTYFGGDQENGIRPGTEPVFLIEAFASAVSEFSGDKYKKVQEVYNYALNKLKNINRIQINSSLLNCSPYIINFSVKFIKSQTMLNFLSAKNIFVSSGSACKKGNLSHVLKALHFDKDIIDSAIRISFSRYTTKEDIDILIEAVLEGITKLVHFKS